MTFHDVKSRIEHISRLRLISKSLAENLKEQHYWLAISMGVTLSSESWLIKNEFKFKIDSGYECLLEYISNDPNLCIAGGYPTLQYLGKNLEEYSESDIDIFIIEKNTEYKDTLTNLLNFIAKKYDRVMYNIVGSSVINLRMIRCRPIQIITTNYKSIT